MKILVKNEIDIYNNKQPHCSNYMLKSNAYIK